MGGERGRGRRWRRSGPCAVALVAFLMVGRGSATTVAPVTLAEMSVAADLVVEGWVAQVAAREEATGIFTYVTLEGLRVVHGRHASPTLELRFAGGEVAGAGERIVGMPSFAVGERVLLFVRGNGSQLCPLVGWHQGRFNVVTDPATGAEFLTDGRGHPVVEVDDREGVRYGARADAPPPTAFAGVPDNAPATPRGLAARAASAPMGLDAFLNEVRRLRRGAGRAVAP